MDNTDYKKLYNEVKKELQLNKRTIEKSNLKLNKYYNDNKERDDFIQNLKAEITNLNKIIEDKDNYNKIKDVKIIELSSMNQGIDTIIVSNNKLKKEINKQQHVIDKLQSESKKINILSNDDKDKLKKIINQNKSLSNEILGLKNKNESLKNSLEELLKEKDSFINVHTKKFNNSISRIIHMLNYNLSINNVEGYRNINSLARRVEIFLERKDKYKQTTDNNFTEISKEVLFGYVFEDYNKATFIDVEGNKYLIRELIGKVNMDVPAKAILTSENSVIIKEFYNGDVIDISTDIKKYKKDDKNKTEEEILDKIKEDIVPINDCSVLIVTGRNEKHYKKYLELYGLNITTFNPFEENINLLPEKIKSQDVIIIMKNAVSHDVMKKIDISDNKIQVIGRDNIKYIVARIRYYIINNKLI